MRIKGSEDEFFLSKVQIDEITECWVWIGTRRKADALYGSYKYGGKQEQAHRASLRIFKGIDAGKSLVRHLCKNGACVNPDHLAIGTNLENSQDRVCHWEQFKKAHPEVFEELKECKRRIWETYRSFVVRVPKTE